MHAISVYANLSLVAFIRIIASILPIASIVSAGVVVITFYCNSFAGSARTSVAFGAGVSVITRCCVIYMNASFSRITAVVGTGIPIIAKGGCVIAGSIVAIVIGAGIAIRAAFVINASLTFSLLRGNGCKSCSVPA
jgi:hypothetical protein